MIVHEELKKQYEEDCKKYERPWELWEYLNLMAPEDGWKPCKKEPKWINDFQYRRKEPSFEPEYYSGLNWREAEKLVGKVVEVSQTGDMWEKVLLVGIDDEKVARDRFTGKNFCKALSPSSRIEHYTYIRTCPQTYIHPTVTIGGVELPRPEVEAPEYNKPYFIFDCTEKGRIFKHTWMDDSYDKMWLRHRIVHLTESRAQAWADFWKNGIMAAVRGGE